MTTESVLLARARERLRRPGRLAGAALVLAVLAAGMQAAEVDEPVDLDAVAALRAEAQERSRVMEFASYLTDVYGPRLTNSPQMRRAADYVRRQFEEMGLHDVKFEPWGHFGRGWENERTSVHVTAPSPWPVLAFPKAWTPGTNGIVSGRAMRVRIGREEDFAAYEGRLHGAILLVSEARAVEPLFEAPGRRLTTADLDAITSAPSSSGSSMDSRGPQSLPPAFRAARMAFFVRQGALAILEQSPGDRGDRGSVRVQGPASGEGSRDAGGPPVLPQLVVAAEHYGRIVRTLEKGLGVTLEIDVRNRFYDDRPDGFNIVAELPGGDRRDEVVMIGAHFDSWHAGTGASDNGGSSAVVLEAMRLLKASGLTMRRTVRAALWTGEEHGLLGSRAYVRQHFGDPVTMTLTPAHGKLAAYFNMDNGGGAFRGVYLQGNERAAPIFRAWMAPFATDGLSALPLRGTRGTDHLAFDEVGLPGFQFVQDPLEYYSRSHHTNLDLYERLVADDLKRNAVVLAAFAYHAANRAEMLPRKPLPAPRRTPAASRRPAGQGPGG